MSVPISMSVSIQHKHKVVVDVDEDEDADKDLDTYISSFREHMRAHNSAKLAVTLLNIKLKTATTALALLSQMIKRSNVKKEFETLALSAFGAFLFM